MKNLTLILLALCLIASNGQAQTAKSIPGPATEIVKPAPPASTLTATAHVLQIFAENGEKFFLVLDGEKINNEPKAKVVARNLEKGFYRAKIIFDDERLPDFNANIQMEGVDPGWNEVTYRIKKKVKRGKTSFSLGYGDWKKIGDATPTRNQAALEDVNRDQQQQVDIHHTEPAVQPVITPNQQVVADPVQPQVMPCNAPLPDASFQALLSTVEGANFEDVKLQTANIISDGNCLTTGQIKQVMQKFNFEDSRLSFAKNAYSRCLDKQNYLLVGSELQFTSSKTALNQFIAGQKK